MSASSQFLHPAEAAQRLGVSAKALRLYEQRGLLIPGRTAAGYRTYGPEDMSRAGEIVALRALGLSLSQVARVLSGDAQALEPALVVHQATLEHRLRELASTLDKVRHLRAELTEGHSPAAADLAQVLGSQPELTVAIELPWPWGGERFELRDIRPLNFIIGPLGSGKTRLAMALAEALPDAMFLGLQRLEHGAAMARAQLNADPDLKARVDQALGWLEEDGATRSDALLALLVGLHADPRAIVVVDTVEQDLDHSTQDAVIAHLRNRPGNRKPLFLMTRSSAILDLVASGTDEAIILCPANHSPPSRVAPYPGSPGYEAVATCLASPEVRARTDGVIAWRPPKIA